MNSPLDRLLAIMARLRDPQHGCPWDKSTCWNAARGAHLAVLQWARQRDACRIRLWVNRTNVPAIALYLRCGFAFTGSEAVHGTSPPHVSLLMVRGL